MGAIHQRSILLLISMKFILILTTFILVGALALTHEDDFVPEVDAIDTMEGEDVALGDERSYLLQSGKKKKTVKSVSIGKLSDYADKQDKNAVKPSFSAKLDAEIQAAKKAAKQATTSFVAADEAASVHAEKCTTEPEKFCNNAGNGGARTFKPLKLSACKMMCMGLKDCTTGYWDKGGGICRLFGVPGAKKKKCKIDARRSTDYTVIKCAKGAKSGGAAKKKAAKKKAPVKKKAPTKKTPAPKKKKKAAAPKKKSSSKKSGAVYVTTKIIFGKNKAFKGWMYKNICPIAAQNMLKCHRCPQKDGNCLEFFKFRNQASFDRYQKLKWLPKPFLTRFINSGTRTTGYKKISKAQYEAGRLGASCEQVNQPPVYATTTVNFGTNIKGFKKWMCKNICPIAAQNMRACHRCPQKGGACREFFKFRNRAS